MRRRYFLGLGGGCCCAGWKEGQIGNLIMGEMGIKSKSADQDGSTWTAPPDIFDPFAFPSIASRPIRSFPRSASNATQRRSKTFPRDARCGWMPPPHPTASILFAVLCLLFFLDSSCAFHAAPKYLLSTQYNTDVYICWTCFISQTHGWISSVLEEGSGGAKCRQKWAIAPLAMQNLH